MRYQLSNSPAVEGFSVIDVSTKESVFRGLPREQAVRIRDAMNGAFLAGLSTSLVIQPFVEEYVKLKEQYDGKTERRTARRRAPSKPSGE